MPVFYDVFTEEGHTIDQLTDSDRGMRIRVSRLGAEMVSIARKNSRDEWEGFLYRDGDLSEPKSGWPYHATVMGPYTHRLRDGVSWYGGERIEGGPHGFLRNALFEAPEQVTTHEGAGLEYTIGPEEYASTDYPRRMRFSVRYVLEEAGVRVTLRAENLEQDRPIHVSFGLHPGFDLGSHEDTCLGLPAGEYVEHMIPGSLLSGETRTFTWEGGCYDLAKVSSGGSIIMGPSQRWEAPLVLTCGATKHRVELDYAEAPFITVWSDGHPFLCVEPVWGLPDHHDQRPFEEKEAVNEIAPRSELTHSFVMRFSFLR